MKQVVHLRRSTRHDKKFMVTVDNTTVHFGAAGYSDFTQHRDRARMHRYLARHRARENWTKSGIKTAGFWSRWLLWSQPSLAGAIRAMEARFDLKIQRK